MRPADRGHLRSDWLILAMPSHLRSCCISSERYKMGTKFASVQATRPALFTEACCFLVGECHQRCDRSRSAATASTRRNSRYSNDTTKQRPPSTRIRRSRLYGREPSSDAPPGAPETELRTPRGRGQRCTAV